MKDKCPKCKKGRLYTQLEKDSGVLTKICYACGYYWDNSEGYKDNPKLTRKLFKKYFHLDIGYSCISSDERYQQEESKRTDDKLPEPGLRGSVNLVFVGCKSSGC